MFNNNVSLPRIYFLRPNMLKFKKDVHLQPKTTKQTQQIYLSFNIRKEYTRRELLQKAG